jgi:ribosomal peptide maturation radical SAM protein 1
MALISMPWMSPNIPSIQLATLGSALAAEGIQSQAYEFFLDYAAAIGLNLYNRLCETGQFIDEYLFATHYYRSETGNDLSDFLRHRPSIGYGSEELEDQVIQAVDLVTSSFLVRLAEDTDWSGYNAVGFSLTISQTASSMALARLIKLRHPGLPIIFGGSSCAGVMGPSLMKICPYIDVVVSIEGELVLPELLRRIALNVDISDIKGISRRVGSEVITNPRSETLYNYSESHHPLKFDAYFERKKNLGCSDRIETWLPFESSRGCWYGETNQCTFCGLHEIMQYRGRPWDSVLSELEHWSAQYNVNRFFSVDLIMPVRYYDSLLPEIKRRGHKWQIFYEIKANVRRSHVEALAAGGVRWIQPGIESLDSTTLKLMKKGVTVIENIQLLKWCEEFGIRVTWNIITGIPMEDPTSYPRMKDLIKNLYHLFPPSGTSTFSLHRFSPYFTEPERYQLKSRGAHPLYQYIFPVGQDLLDDLVYYHKYDVEQPVAPREYTLPVTEAVVGWKEAFRRKAKLAVGDVYDGRASILDTRWSPTPTVYSLSIAEHTLYRFLDESKPKHTLWERFSDAHPEAAKEIADAGGIQDVLSEWESSGLIVGIENRWLALGVSYTREGVAHRNAVGRAVAPIPYLK